MKMRVARKMNFCMKMALQLSVPKKIIITACIVGFLFTTLRSFDKLSCIMQDRMLLKEELSNPLSNTFYSLGTNFTKDKKQILKPKIFYFGVTHHLNRDKLMASNRTWVRTIPKMHWYSDKPDPDLNVTVVSYEPGNTYKLITYRMLMIFQHIYEHHQGYDWYVRLWDDNYLFNDRLVELLQDQDPDEAVLIGKLLDIKFPMHNGEVRRFLYIGGGSVWVLSRSALNRWFTLANANLTNHRTCKMDGVGRYLADIPNYNQHAEDLHLSLCLNSLGVKYVHAYGFQNYNTSHTELRMTNQAVVDGFLPAVELSKIPQEWCSMVKCINVPNKLGIITLHYIWPMEMYKIHDMYLLSQRQQFNRKVKAVAKELKCGQTEIGYIQPNFQKLNT